MCDTYHAKACPGAKADKSLTSGRNGSYPRCRVDLVWDGDVHESTEPTHRESILVAAVHQVLKGIHPFLPSRIEVRYLLQHWAQAVDPRVFIPFPKRFRGQIRNAGF